MTTTDTQPGRKFTQDRITYQVEERITIESLRETLPNLAKFADESGVVAHVLARRPRGKVSHLFYEFASGALVYVTRV
jgi:hypothetical protein